MKHYQLPTGEKIPALGLGTYLSPPEKLEIAIIAAVKAGYRHLDCAAFYKNEEAVGAALQKVFEFCPREKLWITSKLWCDSHKKDAVLTALEKTLDDLGLKYLDLYLMHWPVAFKPGVGLPEKKEDYYSLEEVPLIETWRAMEDCVSRGLVKDIGVSNFSTKKLETLLSHAAVRPAVNQIEMHPYQQQRTQVAFCRKNDITITAYCPLGSVGSTIHASDGSTVPELIANPTITAIARKHQATPAQILLAWLMELGIVAIPKSITPSRIEENYNACNVTLTKEDLSEIAPLDLQARIINGAVFTLHDSPYSLDNIWDGE